MFHFRTDHGPYLMDHAPLVRAVVQVVFPPSAHLATADGLAALQDGLGENFALQAQPQQALQITFGQPAAIPQRYVFADNDGYTLGITPQDLALSIDQRYKSRLEFGSVLERVLAAAGDAGKIKHASRIGVRYINALPATVQDFLLWFRPEFTGWAGRDIVDERTQRAWIIMTQLSGAHEGDPIDAGVIRYGYLPGGVGADVASTNAATEPSFLADIDMTNSNQRSFDAGAIAELFQEINHVIAAFFAHTLSDDGCKQFGLKPKE